MSAARQQTVAHTVTFSGQAAGESPVVPATSWTVDEITEQHDGYWTVHDPATGIFGSGSDQGAARLDLQHALHEHMDVLNRQDVLSPELSAQLAYLRVRLS